VLGGVITTLVGVAVASGAFVAVGSGSLVGSFVGSLVGSFVGSTVGSLVGSTVTLGSTVTVMSGEGDTGGSLSAETTTAPVHKPTPRTNVANTVTTGLTRKFLFLLAPAGAH
jgi:hypothetical protein